MFSNKNCCDIIINLFSCPVVVRFVFGLYLLFFCFSLFARAIESCSSYKFENGVIVFILLFIYLRLFTPMRLRAHNWQTEKSRFLYMKSLFPKPLTSTPDMLLICIIDFLLQLRGDNCMLLAHRPQCTVTLNSN